MDPAAPSSAPVLQDAVDEIVRAGAPGALAYVRGRAGEVLTVGGRRPLSAAHHWRVGSVTKAFVAAVTLQLAAERRLALDDVVARHAPGLVDGDREITLGHLLAMRSGLPDFLPELPVSWLYDPASDPGGHQPREMLGLIAGKPRHAAPGTQTQYSNTNYVLLGEVLERVTGRRIGELIHDQILSPLGLRDTSFPGAARSLPEPTAHGWEADITRLTTKLADAAPECIRALPLHDVTDQDCSAAGAAGAMVSSARDLATFVGALLDGSLLGAEATGLMRRTSPAVSQLSDYYKFRYGLGLVDMTFPSGVHGLGHTGGITGYLTAALRSPETGQTVVLYAGTCYTGDANGARAAVERAVEIALAADCYQAGHSVQPAPAHSKKGRSL